MIATLFVLTVAVGVVGPIAIKYALAAGYSFAPLTFWRSLICIVIVTVFAIRSPGQVRMIFTRIGVTRMFVGGLVLSLSIFSYSALSATEVNILSRLDLPLFLLFFGAGTRRIASGVMVTLGMAYSCYPISTGHGSGVAAIWTATILTAVSYWLIRKAAKKRDLAFLVMPPYIGSVFVSLGQIGHVPEAPSLALLPAIIISSICATSLYVLCAELFKCTRIGVAELTGSFALVGIYIAESTVLGNAPHQFAGVAAFVAAILGGILVYWEEVNIWLKRRA